VYSPTGEVLASAKTFDEELLVVELERRALRRARINNPVMRDEKPEMVKRTLEEIL
jgi:predicted amidohydrolase